MRTLSLINMPFSNLLMPSIALTQLKARLDEEFKDQLRTEVVYLNHDFARYMGVELYNYVTNSMESLNTGLGDWMLRHVLFPELADNSESYWRRYFPHANPATTRLKAAISRLRPGWSALFEDLIKKYRLCDSDIVGFTSMFIQNVASFAMARKLKLHRPDMTLIIGGANCEFPMGRVIAEQIPEIDFVFSGPALKSLPEFLRYWLAGERTKCQSIRGVLSRAAPMPASGAATIGEELNINTPIRLDYEPFIERLHAYFPALNAKPVLPLETSRGCWWGERAHCTFCGLNGASMSYRAMKPDMAIELFNDMFRYTGKVSQLAVVDNILPESYFREVLPFLATPENMEIFYEVKASLTEQDMAALAKARVKQIQPGIESLITPTLKLMKKGTTAFQNLQLLKLCAMYDIRPHWNLLVGFPGEREANYRRYVRILPRLAHLHPPSGVYPVRFDRFSPYFHQAKAYALDLQPLEFYKLIYPFAESDLYDLAYFFADRNIMAEYFTDMARWIGQMRPKVADWQARWNNAGQGLAPKLCFMGDSGKIYDSRSGKAMELSISATGSEILRYLERPVRREELVKALASVGESHLIQELQSLEDMTLVFQENDRFLSLVLDDDREVKRRVEHAMAALPTRSNLPDVAALAVEA